MKRYRISMIATAALIMLACSSCADMLWGVGTDIDTGIDEGPYYYGYNGIWNNAINGFYGPAWTAPLPPARPPRPLFGPGWNGGNPGPARPPQNGQDRPQPSPNRPAYNPEGVSGAPTTAPGGGQRPGNNGRPQGR